MNEIHRPPLNAKAIVGGVLILIGILFTLDGFGLIDAGHFWEYWPLILILVGLRHVTRPSQRGQSTWGWIEIAFGVFFLLRNLGVLWLSWWQIWPILLVVAGGHLVWQALMGRRASEASSPSPTGVSGTMNELAVFGGGDRSIRTADFRGGQVVAIFGGFDIDLREAQMTQPSAVVDIFVLFGGVDLKVPEGWNVVMSVTPILGSAEYKPRPRTSGDAPTHSLTITGTVLFGGVEAKN